MKRIQPQCIHDKVDRTSHSMLSSVARFRHQLRTLEDMFISTQAYARQISPGCCEMRLSVDTAQPGHAQATFGTQNRVLVAPLEVPRSGAWRSSTNTTVIDK